MSCFDVNTTSSISAAAAVAAVGNSTIPNFELVCVMDQLAQLYPSSTNFFNFQMTSQPASLSLPLLSFTTPSTISLSIPPDPISDTVSRCSAASQLHLGNVGTAPVSRLSALNISDLLSAPISIQTSLNTGVSGSFVPPLPSSASGLQESPSSSSSISGQHLSPELIPSALRRKSAPETLIRTTTDVTRRRYSDFNVESLLNRVTDVSHIDHRRCVGRKQRTIYGAKQTKVLEEAFTSQKYMVGTERELLASRLGLSEAQVRVWFQNRRSKQRKILRIEEERQTHY